MSRTSGQNDVISRRLFSDLTDNLFFGFLLTVVGLGLGLIMYTEDMFREAFGAIGALPVGRYIKIFVFLLVTGGPGVWLLVRKTGELLTPYDRQPWGVALRRYGEPRQIIAAVKVEMADGSKVILVGERSRSFSWVSPQVYLTPSWLACFWGAGGSRLTIFRLADVVLVSQVRMPLIFSIAASIRRDTWVALIDRHGVRVVLPFARPDAIRLLAEVLARAPWSTCHFASTSQREAATLGRFMEESARRGIKDFCGQPTSDSSS